MARGHPDLSDPAVRAQIWDDARREAREEAAAEARRDRQRAWRSLKPKWWPW